MTIRVMLGATTRMIRAALHGALAECEDIELVHASSLETLPDIVDVVVLHDATPRGLRKALRTIGDSTRIGVVTIGKDGLDGSLYRVDRQRWRFAAEGRRGLADAIRAVAPAD